MQLYFIAVMEMDIKLQDAMQAVRTDISNLQNGYTFCFR